MKMVSSTVLKILVIIASMVIVVMVILNMMPVRTKPEELLKQILDQEEKVLAKACEHFKLIDKNMNSGTYDFLQQDVVAFEEQVASGRSLSCSANEKTKMLINKIGRLADSSIYRQCVQYKDCRHVLPALQGLEDHFEIRNAHIEGLKIVGDLVNELIPSYAEKATNNNHILENFLLCFEFLLSEAQIFYSLLFHNIHDNLPSFTEQFFTQLNQLVFRVLAIFVAIFLLPKFIWKLHLFVLKALIFLLFLVICIGVFNYVSSFGFSVKYIGLRTQLEENILLIEDISFLESVWKLSEFEDVKIHRNLDALKKVVKHTFIEMKPNISGFPLKKLEKTYEKIQTKLNVMEKVGGREYKELSLEAKKTFENFEVYLKSLIETLTSSQSFYQYVVHGFESLVEVETLELFQLKQFLKAMISKSQDIEENFSNHRNKFLYYISDLNKIYTDIKKFEEANEKNVKKAGVFATLAVAVAFPLFSYGATATLATVGAAGVLYVHTSSLNKNSALTKVDDVNRIFKGYTKDTLEILQDVDPAKLRSAIMAADTSANTVIAHNDLKYYFEESLLMAKENLNEIRGVVQRLRTLFDR